MIGVCGNIVSQFRVTIFFGSMFGDATMPSTWRELADLAHACINDDVDTLRDWILANVDDVPVFDCERCGEMSHRDDACSVDDGDMEWCESCVENAAYYWESDGSYHSEPEEEEVPESEYAAYSTTHGIAGKPGEIGIEVELKFHSDESDVVEAANENGLIAKHDGSLRESNSAEIITAPFKPDRNGIKELGGLMKFLDTVKASGWSKRTYGIHINLDATRITRFDIARLERFLAQNSADIVRVAGREESYYAPILQRGTLQLGTPCTKYAALHILTDQQPGKKRLEFRMFQSNAKATGVRSCAQFALDVTTYCQRCGWRELQWSSFCTMFPAWAHFRTANDEAETT